MSTRGYMGIQKKGEMKGQYNHFDSYLEGLGKEIIKTINKIPKVNRIAVLNEVFKNIILVNEDDKPTQEQIDYCKEKGLVDLNVATQDINDWYCLARKTQGDLNFYINGGVYMVNGNDFLDDDLFCEYGYVINLDDNTLDFYQNGRKLVLKVDLLDLNYNKISKKIGD